MNALYIILGAEIEDGVGIVSSPNLDLVKAFLPSGNKTRHKISRDGLGNGNFELILVFQDIFGHNLRLHAGIIVVAEFVLSGANQFIQGIQGADFVPAIGSLAEGMNHILHDTRVPLTLQIAIQLRFGLAQLRRKAHGIVFQRTLNLAGKRTSFGRILFDKGSLGIDGRKMIPDSRLVAVLATLLPKVSFSNYCTTRNNRALIQEAMKHRQEFRLQIGISPASELRMGITLFLVSRVSIPQKLTGLAIMVEQALELAIVIVKISQIERQSTLAIGQGVCFRVGGNILVKDIFNLNVRIVGGQVGSGKQFGAYRERTRHILFLV